MPQRGERELLAAVPDDFRDELRRLLGGGALGVHAGVLLGSVRQGVPDIAALLRYGMDRLPADQDRPDDALTAFFVVLSELHPCSPELRIFATRCMEYCESDPLDGWSDSLATLRQGYETLSNEMRRSRTP